ncbi:MAG: sensor histidine kinase [Niabella sp.]
MSTSPLSARRFLLSLGVGWLLLVMLQFLLLRRVDFPYRVAAIDSIISNTILLLAALMVLNVTRYYLPTSTYQYIGVMVACAVISILWLLIVNSFLRIFFSDSDVYLSFLRNSLIIRYCIAFLMLVIVTITSVLWYNWIEQKKIETRKTDAERLSKEAELFKLRHQLQPHFLFNSLNSINALIGIDPKQARKMVLQLSDFLRGTLKKEESQMISLGDEMNYLNLYLEIEKVRFGNRLKTDIVIPDDCKQMLIPALLLQPVVENAIKFGLYDTVGETEIKIHCHNENSMLHVLVSNPHDPETSLPIKGTGFGLSSIKRRLYLLFARNDLLTTAGNSNTFETIIRIPQ